MLNKIGKFLTGGATKGIRDVAGQFMAPRDERQMNEHEYKLAVLKQFESYTTSDKGSWFERFVGGLNALPRPLFALGIIVYLGYGLAIDKTAFASLNLITNQAWAFIGVVTTFYFGNRMQVKHLNAKEQAQRIDNMEKTSNLVMDMIDRLDKRNADNGDRDDNSNSTR